MAAMMH